MPMEVAVHALALVILLKCANVRLAPVVKSWESFSVQQLIEIHSVLCDSKNEDYWAQQVLGVLETSYDWECLERGYNVLRQDWKRAVAMNIPMSSYVLHVTDRLEKTMRKASAPFFADTSESTWCVQCQQLLTRLHCEKESLVGMPEVPAETLPSLYALVFCFKKG